MKSTLPRLLTIAVLALLFSKAQASTVDINGTIGNVLGGCGDGTNGSFVCFTASSPDQGAATQIDQIELLFGLPEDSGLMHLYRSNVGGFDEGPFKDIYQATYSDSPGDPSAARIFKNNPGDSINCPSCYLVVKGANGDPAYFFDISAWDGLMDLALTGFWPGPGGAISYTAIYGGISPIPVPAAFWLFGTALIGFIGISRRRSV